MTRKVTGWLVTDFGGEWEDAWEMPARVFTDRSKAERCAEVRSERLSRLDGYLDYCESNVTEIEVVIDD